MFLIYIIQRFQQLDEQLESVQGQLSTLVQQQNSSTNQFQQIVSQIQRDQTEKFELLMQGQKQMIDFLAKSNLRKRESEIRYYTMNPFLLFFETVPYIYSIPILSSHYLFYPIYLSYLC